MILDRSVDYSGAGGLGLVPLGPPMAKLCTMPRYSQVRSTHGEPVLRPTDFPPNYVGLVRAWNYI